jgi:type II secretory pathway predicted ATPase ExeA
MYKHFFGLRENPFNVNPDPRYLFLTPQTQEALDGLTYGIRARKGLILLTGEVGTGKTTLINRLLDWLRQKQTPTAFIFNSQLEVSHLFDFMLADFGVPFDSRLSGNALMRLNQWLFERYRAGETPVLIIDEAQGLPNYVLEAVRMLLNLETSREKLLQIVLAGQPELEERLERFDLRQIKQRIALRCKTTPLTLEETHYYVQARLDIAGANAKPIFASQAMDAVHFYSRGIPRVMNLLCEHALISAYVENVELVPARMVVEVAREFQFDNVKPVVPPIISGAVRDSNLLAAQSAFLNEQLSPPVTPEPPSKGFLGAPAKSVSGPFVVAKREVSPVNEHVGPVLTFEKTPDLMGDAAPSGSSCGQVAASAAPELRPFEDSVPSGLTPHLSDVAIGRLAGVAKIPAARSSILMIIITLRVFLVRWRTRSRHRFLSAVDTLARTQEFAILFRRLQRLVDPVWRWTRWSLGRSDIYPSLDWRQMTVSIGRWLQEPWKPSQRHLPASRLIEARDRISYKKI